MPPNVKPLGKNNVVCRYEQEEHIAHITYRNILLPQVTNDAYDWMAGALQTLPAGHVVRGCIFDFTEVIIFDRRNLAAAHSKGEQFRKDYASLVSRIPTALIVANTYQEMMVRTSMKAAGHLEREDSHVCMVKTMKEAKAFIEAWHEKSAKA